MLLFNAILLKKIFYLNGKWYTKDFAYHYNDFRLIIKNLFSEVKIWQPENKEPKM